MHPALRNLQPQEQSPVLSDAVPPSLASLGTPDPSEWGDQICLEHVESFHIAKLAWK